MSEIVKKSVESRYDSKEFVTLEEKMQLLLTSLVSWKKLTEDVLRLESFSDETIEVPENYKEQLKMLLDLIPLSAEYASLERKKSEIKVLEERINALYMELSNPCTKIRLDAFLMKYNYTGCADTSSKVR